MRLKINYLREIVTLFLLIIIFILLHFSELDLKIIQLIFTKEYDKNIATYQDSINTFKQKLEVTINNHNISSVAYEQRNKSIENVKKDSVDFEILKLFLRASFVNDDDTSIKKLDNQEWKEYLLSELDNNNNVEDSSFVQALRAYTDSRDHFIEKRNLIIIEKEDFFKKAKLYNWLFIILIIYLLRYIFLHYPKGKK